MDLYFNDNKIHYSLTESRISKGTNYFLKKRTVNGFTVHPSGKMDIWFNQSIGHVMTYVKEIFKALNIDWYKEEFSAFITKSIFGKIVVGKITNPEQLTIAIMKSARIKGSHKKLRQAIESGIFSKYEMLNGVKVAKNFDHYVERIISMKAPSFEFTGFSVSEMVDLINQAIMLEEKIDFNWSDKRMIQVHSEFTKIIMDYESDDLSEEPIEILEQYRDLIPIEGFELIDNQKELYKEGRMMNHCVYTNYYNQVLYNNYLVYKVTIDKSRYTLGVRIVKDQFDNKIYFQMDQLKGKRNESPDSKHYDYVKNIIILLSKPFNNGESN